MKTMKAPEGHLNYLSVEGIKVLLAQPDLRTKAGQRDAALLSLLPVSLMTAH